MKFDLASIPPGSTVSSATLNLYLVESDATVDPTYTVTVHKVVNKNPEVSQATGYTYDGVNGWTPNSCCYNNVPLAQSDIAAPVDSKGIDKTVGFKQWDVTSVVQEWLSNPSSNLGLLLNSDASKLRDRWRYFSSMEEPATSQRPYLTVQYTPPAGPPGTVNDLGVVSMTTNSATLSFTEVDDGTGQPAKYDVRYAVAPIAWGSAPSVTQGSCSTPVVGTTIGAHRTCSVLGLSSSTTYDFQLVAYRGTLNQDAVFGGPSNVTEGATGSGATGAGPNEPPGYVRIAEHSFAALPAAGPPGACTGTGLLAGCWFVYDPSGNVSIASVPDAPESPTQVLQFRFASGLPPGSGPGLFQGWDGPGESTNTEYRSIYEASWVRVPTPDFEMQQVMVKFLGYVGVGMNGEGRVPSQIYLASDNPDGVTHPVTSTTVSVFIQDVGDRRMNQNVNTGRVFTFGLWHQVEYVMTLNDTLNNAAVANGRLRVWWDGTLIISYDDVIWRTPAHPSGFWGRRWDPVWGGGGGPNKSRDDFLQIDHVYISGVQ